jgi:hypothetical protein
MVKDFAILLGLPAAVFLVVRMIGKPRAASVLGGLTLLGLLAIFVPNFIKTRERIENVRSAFLEFREGSVAGSSSAVDMLMQSEREALMQASRELEDKVKPEELLRYAGPHPLSHEQITVLFAGPEQCVVRIIWRGEGTVGMLEGDQRIDYPCALEDEQWKFALVDEHLRRTVESFRRPSQ